MIRFAALACALLLSSCVSIKKVDREALRSVFRGHIGEVRACYEARLKEKPDLEGALTVEFDIPPGGKADSAHFIENKSTIKDEPMRACFLEKLATWTFPEPPSGQTLQVAYPYYFTK